MYKDLSLKEKAKVLQYGGKLGLTSVEDIAKLYDEAISYQQGGPIVSPYGQWKYPGRDTIIPSNNITMDNVNYPVLGVSDAGDAKIMMPWNDYKFRGSMVYEHPLNYNTDELFNTIRKVTQQNKQDWRQKGNIMLMPYIPSIDNKNIKQVDGRNYLDKDYGVKLQLLNNHPLIGNLAQEGKKFNKEWKALDNIQYHVYPDTTFTRDKTGYGSIEVFDKNNGDTIRYPNGYTIINPYPGENTIYYNPKYNDEQDIRLDALHLMYQDPVYDALNSEYRYWSSGDVEDDAVKFRDMDMKRYGKAYPLGVYIRNQQDALLRNAFIKGDKEYVKSKNYNDVEQLRKDNWFLMPYIDRIHEYLNTGKKPQNLLPEVVITPNEYKKGGSINIKPENRGKFTALKKRTGHSASWFKAHGTPAQKKMATFALNARKWNHKHQFGGLINALPLAISSKLKDKYIADYANNGLVYGYPTAEELPMYFLSPYIQYKDNEVKPSETEEEYNNRNNLRRSLFAMYFNVPREKLDFNPEDYVVESKYRPSNNDNPNVKYYTIKDKTYFAPSFADHAGRYTVRHGSDENGNYYEVYDEWDLAPFSNLFGEYEKNKNSRGSIENRQPVYLYDRVYQNESPYDYNYYKTASNGRDRFLIGQRYGGEKKQYGGHLFQEDGQMNTNLQTLFDKYGPNSQVIQIDKPIRLNEVQVVADAPKPGDFNYDKYIANTYDAWKRGDVDINALPTETRNKIRGYSGTIAAQKGMNTAAKVAGVTTAVPLGIIGLSELASAGPMVESAVSWLSSKPTLYNLAKMTVGSEIGGRGVDFASNVITGNSWGQNVGNIVEGTTGWNPNNYILGQIALDFTNPGYMGLEGARSLGKSIAHGWNNKLNDLQFKYGVNKFVENTEYPTYQFDNLTNYKSNVKTRKVIDRVIKDNPSLSYEQKQQLRYAAKNMAYTNNVDSGFGAYQPINDRLDGSNLPGLFYPDNKTRLYQINVPKYDSWSNTHEIGHVVNDVEEGLFSSKHGIIPGYRYNSTDLLGNKNEQFSDIFANMYSKRKPFDYLTFQKGNPWSLQNRVDATRNYIFDEGFQNVIGKTDGQIVKDPTKIEVKLQPQTTNNSKKIVHTLDEDDVNYSIKGLVSDLLEPTQSFRNMIRGEKMYKAMTKGKSLPYFTKSVDYESIPISDRTKLIFENYVMPRMKANHPEINEDNILQRLYNTPNYLVREDLFPQVTHTKNALAISNSNENVHSAFYDQLTKSLQHTEPYTDSHELRHTLQRIVGPNKEEQKILRKAYGSSGIKPTEFETMNLDGRTALFQKNKLRKKDGTFFEFDDIDLETQNKIIQNYPDKQFIETIYDSDGYWGYYIDDIVDKSGIDGPFEYVIDELLKTPEFKQTVQNWKDAMKYVGAVAVPTTIVNKSKKKD